MFLSPRTKRRVLFGFAFLCLAVAGALLLMNQPMPRQGAMIAVIASVGFAKMARSIDPNTVVPPKARSARDNGDLTGVGADPEE